MAKPNQGSRFDQRKADPTKTQVVEKEEEGAEKDANESDQKQNELQNTLGNQALQDQMIGNPDSAGGTGAGGGGGLSVRKAAADQDRDYGGEDDDASDVPLTLEDLVRSWNPSISKTEDRESWLEPMPSDELPPENQAFLDEVRTREPISVLGGFTLDSRLQPSKTVVATGILDWTAEAGAWIGQSLLERTIHRVLNAAFLQDPEARLLLTRTRACAVASLLMVNHHKKEPSTADIALQGFCLELRGHRRHAELVRIDPGVEGKQMPSTVDVLARAIAENARSVNNQPLPESGSRRAKKVLEDLLDMESPSVYLPPLTQIDLSAEEDNDPLNIDAVLAEFTGGAPDRDEQLYQSALDAAERLAAATARSRIHVAAVAAALAQVCKQWSSGVPYQSLHRICDVIDKTSDKTLHLIVEIARAAQGRSVPPKGLKAGLTRVTRALTKLHETAVLLFLDVIGGVLPGAPTAPSLPPLIQDPLHEAWLDGNPTHCLPWLSSLPSTPDVVAARALVRAAAGQPTPSFLDPLLSATRRLPPGPLRSAVEILSGPALLKMGRYDDALELSSRHIDLGMKRRNGMVLANAALLGVEALTAQHRRQEAHELLIASGQRAWAIGAPGALSVLARHTL